MNKIIPHIETTIPDSARTFFVGDIHGNLGMLNRAIDQLDIDIDKDYIISVGDLIDRGKNSLEVLDFFTTRPNIMAIIGNHELFPMDGDILLWLCNGGAWAFNSLVLDDNSVDKEFVETLYTLPAARTILHKGRTFGVVHAEVPYPNTVVGREIENDWVRFIKFLEEFMPNKTLTEAVWGRNRISKEAQTITNIDMVFCGHTYTEEPLLKGNTLFIDTGAVFGKYLTLIEITDTGYLTHKIS